MPAKADKRFQVTDWIKGQTIAPLKWGNSAKDITAHFKGSEKQIDYCRNTDTPFLTLDFVEFYFEDDKELAGLQTVLIKPVGIYKGIQTKYFSKDWLHAGLSFAETCKQLERLKIEFELHQNNADQETPYLTTKTGQIFVFYYKDIDINMPLQKIYINKQ